MNSLLKIIIIDLILVSCFWGINRGYALEYRDREITDTLLRDFICSSPDEKATFIVDLPNDEYHLTIIIGDNDYPHKTMKISIQDKITAQGLSTELGKYTQIKTRVKITNNRLRITFSSDNEWWIVNAIIISKDKNIIYAFDCGTPNSPVTEGFIQLTPFMFYNKIKGFGWEINSSSSTKKIIVFIFIISIMTILLITTKPFYKDKLLKLTYLIETYLKNSTVKLDLFFLFILTFFLGTGGGVPYFHTDSSQNLIVSIRTITNNGNPQFFNYPGLVFYVNNLFYRATYVILKFTGLAENANDFFNSFTQEKIEMTPLLYFPGHLVTILFSMLGICCTYFLTLKLIKKRTISLLSALFLLTAILWVANSHYVTVDIPLVSLSILTVLLIVIFTYDKKPLKLKHLLILGVLLGLTTSVKYNGALIFSSILFPMIFCYQKKSLRLLRDSIIILLISICIFLLTNPFIILDFNKFLKDFLFELNHSKVGHLGYNNDRGLLFHLTHSLYLGYGLIPLILSFLGFIWIIRTKTIKIQSKVAVTTFPIIFYLLMSIPKLAFQRYMLPVLPFLGIYSALGIYFIYDELKKISINKLPQLKPFLVPFITILFIISILPNVRNSIRHNLLLMKNDTRKELLNVITNASLNEYKMDIYAGYYTSNYITKTNISIKNIKEYLGPYLLNDGTDLIVIDSFSYDKLLYDKECDITQPYTNYENMYVIQLSPFRPKKDKVPFSRDSVYSPYPPDLEFRKKPGPFIEIYCKDKHIAQKIEISCRKSRVDYEILSGKECYYFNKLNEKYNEWLRRQKKQ